MNYNYVVQRFTVISVVEKANAWQILWSLAFIIPSTLCVLYNNRCPHNTQMCGRLGCWTTHTCKLGLRPWCKGYITGVQDLAAEPPIHASWDYVTDARGILQVFRTWLLYPTYFQVVSHMHVLWIWLLSHPYFQSITGMYWRLACCTTHTGKGYITDVEDMTCSCTIHTCIKSVIQDLTSVPPTLVMDLYIQVLRTWLLYHPHL